jgi:hypothetical protein
MKTSFSRLNGLPIWSGLAAAMLGLSSNLWAAADVQVRVSGDAVTAEPIIEANSTNATKQKQIIVRTVEAEPDADPRQSGRSTWLGIATEEAPEALSAQLGLEPGVGLVVTHVTPDSPAAKGGLQKNDLVVELAGQKLILPSQLGKLVRVRKEGEAVKVVYYRAGKEQTTTVTLGKRNPEHRLLSDGRDWQGELREVQQHLKDLHLEDTIHGKMKDLQESLSRLNIDREGVQRELRRSLQETRRALQDALRYMTNSAKATDPSVKALEDLAGHGVELRKNTTVTVQNDTQTIKTLVKTDETGTYVVVGNPKKRLTAHGKDGTLLFEGDIETPEQQAKVPKAVWEKVESLLKQREAGGKPKPGPESESAEEGR